ncbi:hypothetical protein Barb4_04515 [Bacteroidales bacterium Barb4]|nr:hypothetical protein Barb4_04515 [Bacteroidales bacterium Barb4]
MADDLGKDYFLHGQTIAAQGIGTECRTFRLPDGRQLSSVAHQYQAAVFPRIDVLNQVVQQATRAEHKRILPAVGNHGSLIHNEESVLMQVLGRLEVRCFVRERLLAVNLFMDSECLLPRIAGKDLGGSARRSEENSFLRQFAKGFHQSTRQGSLPRSRIPFEQQERVATACEKETDKGLYGGGLVGSRGMREIAGDVLSRKSMLHLSNLLLWHKTAAGNAPVSVLPFTIKPAETGGMRFVIRFAAECFDKDAFGNKLMKEALLLHL